MVCIPDNLSFRVSANGNKLWHYATTDAIHQIESDGYFNPICSKLTEGDLIAVNNDLPHHKLTAFYTVMTCHADNVIIVERK